jgi:molybdopterin-containing oxidoreductase family membrane subunit
MKENIIQILQIITIDFFFAFGLYSILFLIVRIFTKNEILLEIDKHAKKFISFVGLIFFVFWIVGIFTSYFENNADEQNRMLNRIFGKYWFGFWIQPLLWFTITQILRSEKLSKNIFLRIVFSFFLIFSIEKLIILIITFHRDYLPSSWAMYNELEFYPSNIFLGMLLKIILFLIFTWIYYFTKNKIKNYR